MACPGIDCLQVVAVVQGRDANFSLKLEAACQIQAQSTVLQRLRSIALREITKLSCPIRTTIV